MRYVLVLLILWCAGCQQRSGIDSDQARRDAEAAADAAAAAVASAAVPSTSDAEITQEDIAALLATPPPSATPTFYGNPCTVDCSGHDAGYTWAEDNEVEDPDDCGGNSQSFIEGCESYAEERQEEARAREEEEEEERAREEAEAAENAAENEEYQDEY